VTRSNATNDVAKQRSRGKVHAVLRVIVMYDTIRNTMSLR